MPATPSAKHPRGGVGAFLKKELRELIPPTIFFLIAFLLLLLTQALVLEQYGIDKLDLVQAVIGALIAGKVLLIVDAFHFVDRFPDRPLIWNTLGKALLYNIAALLFRYLEAAIPLWLDHGFSAGNATLMAAVHWPHFWLVQLWLAVLFLIYCAAREFFHAIGRERVLALFFGPARARGEESGA